MGLCDLDELAKRKKAEAEAYEKAFGDPNEHPGKPINDFFYDSFLGYLIRGGYSGFSLGKSIGGPFAGIGAMPLEIIKGGKDYNERGK